MILETNIKLEENFKQKRVKKIYQKELHGYIFINVKGEIQEDVSIRYRNTKRTTGWEMWINGKIYSNKKEAALYSAHKDEYEKEFNLKLRKKRSKSVLASPWNEEPCSFMDKAKSWKDSTKRRKQYYK